MLDGIEIRGAQSSVDPGSATPIPWEEAWGSTHGPAKRMMGWNVPHVGAFGWGVRKRIL